MKAFTIYIQADAKDCGPTCLKIIAKHYGQTINIQTLREYSETNREGSNLLFLSDAAKKIGFRSLGVKLSAEKLTKAPLPCILHWDNVHYVVLYKIKKGIYFISDPAFGLLEYNEQDFLKSWVGNNATNATEEGIALLLETTPNLFKTNDSENEKNTFGFS